MKGPQACFKRLGNGFYPATEWGIVLRVQVYFVRVHMPWGTWGRQRTPSERQLSASVMRALGMNSGLPASKHISLPTETSHWSPSDNFIVAW